MKLADPRYTILHKCAHGGCRESSFSAYDNRRDYRAGSKRWASKPWYCYRHSAPNEVLSPTNRVREEVIEAKYGEHSGIDKLLFWHGNCPTSGCTHGLGWRARADDFPVGTKIKIRAEVVLPDNKDEH
jgi:hypothetical protein